MQSLCGSCRLGVHPMLISLHVATLNVHYAMNVRFVNIHWTNITESCVMCPPPVRANVCEEAFNSGTKRSGAGKTTGWILPSSSCITESCAGKTTKMPIAHCCFSQFVANFTLELCWILVFIYHIGSFSSGCTELLDSTRDYVVGFGCSTLSLLEEEFFEK